MLSNAYGGVYSTSVAADGSSGYEGSQGTSMACPHVSGVAALIVSQFGAPGFTNEQLKEKLFSTARDIDSYQGPIYNGRGTYAGKIGKLVDAGAALDSGEVPPVSKLAMNRSTPACVRRCSGAEISP